MHFSKIKRGGRRQNGSGIVEGVMGVVLIAAVTVGGTALLINSAVAGYYKEKLGFIANQAAKFAADSASWNGSFKPSARTDSLNAGTRDVVNEMLSTVGLPEAREVSVTIENQQVVVEIAVEGFALPSGGGIFPAAISLQDRGVAVLNDTLPPALLTVSLEGRPDTMVTIPAYGRFIPGFSNGAFGQSQFSQAPPGTALFNNRPAGSYSQFNLNAAPGSFSQTLATQ